MNLKMKKKTKPKKRWQITFCLLTFTVLLFNSCKKNDDIPSNCGCDSSIVFTILESDEQQGFLYINTANNNENIPPYNYGIYFTEPNCDNCVHTFFVCNNDFLNNLEIPNYPGVKVQFSGKAKKVCQGIWAPGDYTYNYITLTSIKIK